MIKEILDPHILIEVENELEGHRFKTFFDKEPETIAWIREMVNPGDVFLDVGANIGVFSLFAAAFHEQRIKIFALEPVYHNFYKLCKNILLNGFEQSVTPICLGLGESVGIGRMHLASLEMGSASHTMGRAEEAKSLFDQGLAIFSLDSIVNNGWMAVPNHIKIDTDGSEEQIIAGAMVTLARKEVRSVLIEVTNEDGSKERIIDALKSAGFGLGSELNTRLPHSRTRREAAGKSDIENLIFTK